MNFTTNLENNRSQKKEVHADMQLILNITELNRLNQIL